MSKLTKLPKGTNRPTDIDRKVVRAAQGLDFLVLDELHTYRGRQGADVALHHFGQGAAAGDEPMSPTVVLSPRPRLERAVVGSSVAAGAAALRQG